MPDAPVLLAGRYRLGESLGRGGMGEVRLARDETLQRDVAIKEIDQPVGTDGAAAARRTLREARAAARIGHPNVVQVYDVLQLDDRTWIVMEYVPSRSLREEIAEQGPLDPYRVARIGLDLLGALRTAHRLGVEHRDVKPANVLLADDGRVLLTDFGIAAVDDDGVISRSDVLVGSPQFMAPERAQGKASGPAADFWSLGATLYAAIEGHAPYQRGSTMATLAALATEEPDPPVHAGPLRPLLDGLLVKDPAARMHAEDAESLARQILTELSGETEPPATRRAGGLAGLAASIPAAFRIPRPRTTAESVESSGGAAAEDGGGTSATSATSATSGAAAADLAGSESGAGVSDGASGETPPGPDAVEGDAGDPAAGAHGAAEPRGDERAGPETAGSPGDSADVPPDDGVGEPPTAPAAAAVGFVPRQRRSGVPDDESTAVTASDRPSRRGVLIGAAALAVVVAAGAGWAMSSGPDEPVAKPQPSVTAASAGPAATSAAPSVDAAQQPPASPSSAPAASPTADAGTDSGARPPLPAGWRDYRDPTGFSVYVPEGWSRSQSGSIVYFRKGGKILGIDQTDEPRSNPVKDWQTQARNRVRGGDFVNYQEVGIKAVDYFRKAADWEFLHTRDGVRKHVNNRGTVISDDKAYGFYWETPESEWAASQADLKLIFESFQPAK
ncbi:hypothetical protein Ait01nite_053350 [Actinoplanes italicus]|uniref:Serine/threonine protein kinase n=1 Tax=Actinoplanes italicus TaxID=113567 RepID=A0A2T0K7Y9_9ACTN|nr:serine/threonine-protein kinase [Actinoplanes italicus]PRX19132.1 serine/threonine protein kinase [Actinoplanes italicus]GIE32290.1 hypothetical protein Ait01nite_053350 [Actinoplanes italicus]